MHFLKQGQLTEFTSILGAHPNLRPEFYTNDSWVEFIQVDIDEPSEMVEDFDTPLLFSESHVFDSPPTSSSFQDDDSGRASCCDPDLSDHDHHDTHHPSTSTQDGFHTLMSPANLGPVGIVWESVVPPAQEPAWQNSVYSQVAEVMPCGETLLCPEHEGIDYCCAQDKATEYKKKKPWLMMNLNENGYSSNEPSSTTNPWSEGNSTPQQSQKPEMNPTTSAFPILKVPSPPEYTMVDGVGWKDSLLLKTNCSSAAASTPALPKSGPTLEGYLPPDLMHSVALNQ